MTNEEVTLTRSVIVEASPGRLFEICRDTGSLAALLSDVATVEQIGERRQRWQTALDGTRGTWETEVLKLDPPERIEWRVPSRDGRTACTGAVEFQPQPAGGTEVRLVMRCEGTPGASVSDTSRIVDVALESLKSTAESREAAPAAASRLDADRAASMADEGGAAAAATAGGTPPSPTR